MNTNELQGEQSGSNRYNATRRFAGALQLLELHEGIACMSLGI